MVGNATPLKVNSSLTLKGVEKVFIAAPMSGLGSDAEYRKARSSVLNIVRHLRDGYGLRDENIYYAGRNIDSQSEFGDATLALKSDLAALAKTDVFMLYYPVKVASSVLVEAGYALACKKPMILFPKNSSDLPYFFKQAASASNENGEIPDLKIYEYGSESNLLQKVDLALNEIVAS